MRDIIEAIAKNLVKNPGAVKVEAMTDGRNTAYHVSVLREDRGMIIGKNGATIQAISHIVHCMHAKDGFKATVEIVEEA